MLIQERLFMGITYYPAPDLKRLVNDIVFRLGLSYIDPHKIYCFRSKGSKSTRIVARIHSLGKLWQQALNIQPRYLIEIISERYDKLSQSEQEKILIHEILHIPKGFAGGFRPHKGYISRKKIANLHKLYRQHNITTSETALHI
jgi:predicted metallopeptidase